MKVSHDHDADLRQQLSAVGYIREFALKAKLSANEIIDQILMMRNVNRSSYQRALEKLREFGQVAIHFHPDRFDKKSRVVAESLYEDGFYKNQFETTISNGGLSAFAGGQRDSWEKHLFGSVYDSETPYNLRPKYGALDFKFCSEGPAPRFGSCYFLLKPSVNSRCTYTFLDSNIINQPGQGTWDEFDAVLAEILKESFMRGSVFLNKNMNVSGFISHLLDEIAFSKNYFAEDISSRNLDFYVESQIHGSINLKVDVDKMVCDSSFRDTHIHRHLERIQEAYNIPIYWYPAFTLSVKDVPDDFRGNSMPQFAKKIAQLGSINAFVIGEAARLARKSARDSNSAEEKKFLNDIKYLWHILVMFGERTL